MTSVQQVFEAAGIRKSEVVRWGQPVPVTLPGVYIVSTSPDPLASTGLPQPPFDLESFTTLLHARPELRINGAPAGLPELAARLEYMWPAGEPIVYIGRSGSTLRKRVGAFYRHKLGAPKPHGGGWPVKLLNPDQLWVHFASTQESLHIEIEMLDAFTAGLPVPARVALIDSDLALPFANLERKKGQTKKHGITGAK